MDSLTFVYLRGVQLIHAVYHACAQRRAAHIQVDPTIHVSNMRLAAHHYQFIIIIIIINDSL